MRYFEGVSYFNILHLCVVIVVPGDLVKIPQRKSGDIYVAKEYFMYQIFYVYSAYYFFKSLSNFAPIYLTFGEVMQRQSQCSIFTNKQLTVSNFA